MTFQKGKRAVMVLFGLAIFICVMGLITFEEGSTGMAICVAAAVVCLIGGLVACSLWCRCPHCGSRLFRKVLSLKACPYCGRDFESGKKVQKVKKR
jgi:hypothetical protein